MTGLPRQHHWRYCRLDAGMAASRNVAKSSNSIDCGHCFQFGGIFAHTDVEMRIPVGTSLDREGVVPAAMPLAS